MTLLVLAVSRSIPARLWRSALSGDPVAAVGGTNNRWFINAASIGFGAVVATTTSPELKRANFDAVRPVPVNLDVEPAEFTQVRYEATPGGVRLIVPPSCPMIHRGLRFETVLPLRSGGWLSEVTAGRRRT